MDTQRINLPPSSGARITTALGGLFSATAGPLLPDNIAFKSLNKMWRSQSSEDLRRTAMVAAQRESHHSPQYDVPMVPPPRGSSPFKVFNRATAYSGYSTLPSQPVTNGNGYHNAEQKNKLIPDILKVGKKFMKKLPSFDTDEMVGSDGDQGRRSSNDSMQQGVNVIDTNGLYHDEPDDTPNYEDSQDLESTISKLRSLLSERESVENDDSGTRDSDDDQDAPGDEDDDDKVTALKASDLPTDGRLILDVRIAETEMVQIAGNSNKDNQSIEGPPSLLDANLSNVHPAVVPLEEGYALFCIRYNGIYLEQLPASNRFRYVLQPRLVKRRFKEFINLQLALEANQRLRNVVRTIKGPSKWTGIALTKQGVADNETKRYLIKTVNHNVGQQVRVI